jgi:hypothetical protein
LIVLSHASVPYSFVVGHPRTPLAPALINGAIFTVTGADRGNVTATQIDWGLSSTSFAVSLLATSRVASIVASLGWSAGGN